MSVYRTFGKRGLDLVLASIGFLLLAPLMAVVALLIRMRMGRPILFRHERPGLHGRPFGVWKFRTMSNQPGPDADRLTPLGRTLRAASLDELPELYNVLKGEMSLVGPRPLMMRYLPLYNAEQARRHEVRPGITGWAQVNGRNAQTWEDRFRYDVWYVDHYSLGLDLKILCLTIWRVLRREGISAEGHATMPGFQGTPRN